MVGYACRIIPENIPVIASENPKFDREFLLDWIKVHETGYFVRNPGSTFDCTYMSDFVFNEIYLFQTKDEDALFRRILEK